MTDSTDGAAGGALQLPTLIIANGRIATGDPRRPWISGLAFCGEALAAMGSAAEILKLAGPSTRIVDAQGQTIVLPLGMVPGRGDIIHVTLGADGTVTLQS